MSVQDQPRYDLPIKPATRYNYNIIANEYIVTGLVKTATEEKLQQMQERDCQTKERARPAMDAENSVTYCRVTNPGNPVSYTHLDVYKRQKYTRCNFL